MDLKAKNRRAKINQCQDKMEKEDQKFKVENFEDRSLQEGEEKTQKIGKQKIKRILEDRKTQRGRKQKKKELRQARKPKQLRAKIQVQQKTRRQKQG